MTETQSRIKQYDFLIRRLRADERLWDEDDRVHQLLGKALERRKKLRSKTTSDEKRGLYSGLTRSELKQSGTCEADWY